MKDRIFLIAAAVGCAMGSWALWHYLGEYALNTLVIVALVTVTGDNFRLRRKLRERCSDHC